MKPSIWNMLSLILLAGVVLMIVFFGVIFLVPNQVLPEAFRPVLVPNALLLPTATETPPVFPPTWTQTPPPTNTAVIPSATVTPSLTNTTFLLPSKSATSTPTKTYTPTVTSTKSGVVIIVNGTARTATKAAKPTKTPTKNPTRTPGGPPPFQAEDDFVEMLPAPAYVQVNILANDYHFAGLPIRIVNFTKLPKHGDVEKVNNSTTDIIYRPDVGFVGLDSFEYKMTDEPGSTDFGMVYISVGTLSWPTDITLDVTTIAENRTAGTTVGQFTTSDPDAPFIYKLVVGDGDNNNNLFLITGDTLKTTASYNAETTPSLSIRVRSTDSTGMFFEKKFIITVTSVNEAPTITVITAPQGKAGYAYEGLVRAIDPDTGDTLTFTCPTAPYEIVCISNLDKTSTISGTIPEGVSGLISFIVRVTDSGTLYDEESFTFNVIVPTPTMTPTTPPP